MTWEAGVTSQKSSHSPTDASASRLTWSSVGDGGRRHGHGEADAAAAVLAAAAAPAAATEEQRGGF